MKVFFSHSVAASDGPLASRLRAVAAAYDVTLILPERAGKARALGAATRALIQESDAVLALVTAGSEDQKAVEAEIEAAIAEKKALVVLAEASVSLPKSEGEVHLVHFKRTDPASHESDLGRALEALQKQRKRAREREAAVRTSIAIGAIAGIVVGLLALGAMMGDQEPAKARVG